ncbi:MAG: DUF3135 domain-containing protein [Burkholderiales bacterium]|nr:DUF3135 domain-containing protein [Burkholderiales bacterium]MDR4516081.1 DUF3135 domain-containing protein [Nitrosomonas sp.]
MKNNEHPPGESITDFDFEKWSHIAKTDPEKFELMRQQLIDDLLAQVPDHLKQRITQQQWQIDQICKQAENPLAACKQISQKMWDSVYGENGLLTALQAPEKILLSRKNNNTENVIHLKKYKSTRKPVD